MKKLVVTALVAASAVAPALAQDFPLYDVDGHCRRVSGLGSGSAEATMRTCMQYEQRAHDGLKPRWAGIADNVRERCKRVATFGAPGSYDLLQKCIRAQEESARPNA